MTLLRGRGYAAVNYPTGMNLGGDPSQALIHSTTTGTFVVSLSSVDLGQGLKTVVAQCAAETLGLPYENVLIDTADTDTGPHCMGTFASRGTHRVGNAVIMAAREAREVMLEVAAEELEVDPHDLETDGTGYIKLKGSEEKKIHIVDLALAAHFKHGRTISGRGMFLKEKNDPVPETGQMDPDSCQAHACTIAEVEVDDETGVVTVLDMYNVYEVGRALNPATATQQIEGGAWMGMSHALFEATEPYYPARDHGPKDFSEYLMPGPGDLATMHSVILERPADNGPYGAKGIGEMTANAPIPAIANAIFDACGARLEHLPFTPERVLRALVVALAAQPACGRTPVPATHPKESRGMLKVISLLRRAEGMSKAEFRQWATNEHPKLALEIPGLRRYSVSVTGDDSDSAYDGVNELYFDDEEARVAGFGSEAGKAAAADAGQHTSERVHLLTEEHELLGGGQRRS